MFVISIVLPLAAVRMSPGRMLRPLGMFSAAATTAIARTGISSSASAPIPATTAAAPAMSPFMSSMCVAGFSEMPPESNVIPLPTSPSRTSLRAGARRLPAQHDEAGLVVAPGADAEQRAHAEIAHLVGAERLGAETAGAVGDARLRTRRSSRA